MGHLLPARRAGPLQPRSESEDALACSAARGYPELWKALVFGGQPDGSRTLVVGRCRNLSRVAPSLLGTALRPAP